MNRAKLVVLFTIVLACSASSISKIRVCGRWFCDSQGRVRIFHGMNDVQEAKDKGHFTGHNFLPHLTMEDGVQDQVASWGFNVIRMPMMWSAIQPAQGQVDAAYLLAIRNTTQQLGSKGIYSFLDMHQDVMSSAFGSYDGVPRWLINLTIPRHPYPWPLKLPLSQWGFGYLTEAVGQAFQELYQNTRGGRDAWAAAWKGVAQVFRSDSEILGYELLNEPFPGDIWSDPLLLLPGVAGSRNLMPAYDAVAGAIREVDEETIVMFEPLTWGMIFPDSGPARKIAGAGFDAVPGGAEFKNRSAFAFHYYCWFATGISEQKGSTGPYKPLQKAECDRAFGPLVFDSVEDTIDQIGGASILTEFGAMVPNATNRTELGTEEMEWVLNEADKRFQSWTYWDMISLFSYNVSTQAHMGKMDGVKTFVRPYAQAIAGEPQSTAFDYASDMFSFTFAPVLELGASEVIVPQLRYPTGFVYDCSENLKCDLCPGRFDLLCAVASSTSTATIRIHPK